MVVTVFKWRSSPVVPTESSIFPALVRSAYFDLVLLVFSILFHLQQAYVICLKFLANAPITFIIDIWRFLWSPNTYLLSYHKYLYIWSLFTRYYQNTRYQVLHFLLSISKRKRHCCLFKIRIILVSVLIYLYRESETTQAQTIWSHSLYWTKQMLSLTHCTMEVAEWETIWFLKSSLHNCIGTPHKHT